jgi:hypothetical protein
MMRRVITWLIKKVLATSKPILISSILQHIPKQSPILMERYGQKVWELPAWDEARRTHCLCHRCKKMRPGKEDHCKIASSFYEICKAHGTAFILTRCDSAEPLDGEKWAGRE